MYFVDQHPSQS